MTRFSTFAASAVVSLLSLQSCVGFSNTNIGNNNRIQSSLSNAPEGNDTGKIMERRSLLKNIAAAAAFSITATTVSTTQPARALDFDAFESGEITKDDTKSKPSLNDDEALCKYGAPGRAMGEACDRAKITRKLPGGVSATGKVDRGEYLVCKYEYPIIDNKYVKTRVCKPSSEWGAP
mmetsp:Transcript_16026/g.28965  ORF Transcript_16026/g.28965 Transcript_16026/m.28965 type:complete len:178 (-) Transcript_16026:527-1060(-)